MRISVGMVCVAVLASLSPNVFAAQTESTKPTEVAVGVYVNQVRELSLRDSQFVADFWIWFRWPGGAGLDPLASFEIVGGDIESKANEYRGDLADGKWNYAYVRVIARVVQVLDVSDFPQDRHSLVIAIEDGVNNDQTVRFVPDSANSRIDPDVNVPGFQVASFSTTVAPHTYKTNYGDITLPADSASTYSRFEFALNVERPGFGYALKLVWGMWLSALIAILALFIKPINVDPRFGLGVGAVFAAMANQYVVASALPDTTTVTAADIVGMSTIVVILVCVTESVASLWLYENDKVMLSKRLDGCTIVAVLTVYLAVNAYALLLR